MRSVHLLLGLFLLSLLAPAAAQADPLPLCNGTCEPDPSSPDYAQTIKQRPKSHNSRGGSSVTAPDAPGAAAASRVKPGSESYSYALPILSLPGRNGLDVNLTLYYSSRVWTVNKSNNTVTFNADRDFPGYGFRLGFGYIEGPFNDDFGISTFLLTEPDGSKRELRQATTNRYDATDASYIDWRKDTYVLRRKDGTRWEYQRVGTSKFYRPIKIKDTNGNFIDITYQTDTGFNNQAIATITDTLGRVIRFDYGDLPETVPNDHILEKVVQVDSSGVILKTYTTFTWAANVKLKYNFSLTVKDSPLNDSNINVITRCAYPDNGTGYEFVYIGPAGEADWGIVTKIEQKSATGAVRSYVNYNYPLTSDGQLADHPAFTQQTVSDGVNTATWTYAVTKSGGLVSTMAITDPAATATKTYLFTSGWQTGLVEKVEIKNGTATFRTITNEWTQDDTTVSYRTNPRLTSVTTTYGDNEQSRVELSYTTYANVSEVREFDLGLQLRRKTQTDYLTNSNYTSRHILDRPKQARVYDGASSLKARTDFAYDGTTLTSVTGLTTHDDTNYGSAFTYRGNVTAITRYANAAAGTGAITRSFFYDTLGNLRKAELDCCQEREWIFTPTTWYAYPETIKTGPVGTQLETSRTYDFNTGLVLTATDENNKTTEFQYDSMNRMTQVNRPDGAQLTTSYDDAAASPRVTSTTPIDATNSVVQVTTTDGLGRTLNRQTKNPSGAICSAVETQLDALGRPFKVSNPYDCSSGASLWTETQYDALSRPTKVIPPDGTPASNNYQYSYQGNKTTVTDPAGKQRATYTDAFGRIVQAHEPGYADGASGAGWVTISGSWYCVGTGENRWCESGKVWITVDNFTATVCYGDTPPAPCDTETGAFPSDLASALADLFNNHPASPVTATRSGSTVNFTAKQEGVHTNYALSAGEQGVSFTVTKSGNNLTGGADGAGGDGSQPSLSTPLVTVYSYDPLDNLAKVTQGVQQRSFAYDSLGRLLSATTPEAGTVSYAYTTFSQVATRTDARNALTSYSYDALHRLAQVSYDVSGAPGVSVTSVVNFTYGTDPAQNNKGRLLTMTDGAGSEAYEYDLLARVTKVTKVIDGTSYPVDYTYNRLGEITSLKYPSTRLVQQTYDPIARLVTISDAATNYVTNVTYNAAHRPTAYNYGNSVQAAFGYNSRLEMTSLSYTQAATKLLELAYSYSHPNGGNNGQVTGISDSTGTPEAGRSVNYTYDAWARLKTALTTGSSTYPQWGLSWDYDRFGNRKNQNVTAGSAPAPQLAIDPNTNRITSTGYSYLEGSATAGNLTNDTVNKYTYDAENRITEVKTQAGSVVATYTYDGAGVRVKKETGGTTTRYIFSGTKVIAEYTGDPPALSKEYIYAGSQLVATIEGSTTTYHHADHLSVRVTTDAQGTKLGEQAHYPFGEAWYETGITDKWKFTSYEREAESGLDYAMFRYDATRLGRFMTPDPIAGSLVDPQSLNRYSYVGNDPTNLRDPLGLCPLVCWQVCTRIGGREECGPVQCESDCSATRSGSLDLAGLERALQQRREAWILWLHTLRIGLSDLRDSLHLRQPGETIPGCVQRVQQAVLGKTGAAVLNATALVSPALLAASTAQVAVPVPIPKSLTHLEQFVYGTAQAVWKATPLEALALEGPFGARGLAFAQTASSAVSRVAVPTTAVSTALVLAFVLDCL